MPTLRELIDKHGMGQGQRYHKGTMEPRAWFEPMRMRMSVDRGKIIGFNIGEFGAKWDLDLYDDWSLYEEPKKKVTRWLWAWKENVEGALWTYPTRQVFLSEAEAEDWFYKEAKQKLEWSRTEFES